MAVTFIISLIFLSAALGALALYYGAERDRWRARYEALSRLTDAIIEQSLRRDMNDGGEW